MSRQRSTFGTGSLRDASVTETIEYSAFSGTRWKQRAVCCSYPILLIFHEILEDRPVDKINFCVCHFYPVRPLKAQTRVQIPLGPPAFALVPRASAGKPAVVMTDRVKSRNECDEYPATHNPFARYPCRGEVAFRKTITAPFTDPSLSRIGEALS